MARKYYNTGMCGRNYAALEVTHFMAGFSVCVYSGECESNTEPQLSSKEVVLTREQAADLAHGLLRALRDSEPGGGALPIMEGEIEE
jgi:hypothetical protein